MLKKILQMQILLFAGFDPMTCSRKQDSSAFRLSATILIMNVESSLRS